MKYVSTRKGIEASSAETIFQGLAPDGGLYVPNLPNVPTPSNIPNLASLRDAEEFVMSALFDDLPADVRSAAADRLCGRFPKDDPIPLVEKDGLHILELFHGRTGAFKDVALSMLPVFMKHAANGKRVLILTATSGDTGSAAMQGFAGVEGTEIIVFYPATGTSKVQRLQMTTPADRNVHAVGIKGNFDDAQAAVKRIFADKAIAAEAAAHGITLSSANSINTGRLVPQIAYYVLAGVKLLAQCGGETPPPHDGSLRGGAVSSPTHDGSLRGGAVSPPTHDGSLRGGAVSAAQFDVVVPSGNFGNILAAYYAKLLGSPIRKLVVASNINDVLARFVKTGVYDPGDRFTVTNSPSMDIRKSSNVERLLWILNDGNCAEVARLMGDLDTKGRYELNDAAKAKLRADFEGGVATPDETEAEMRRMREACGYLLDPHTAVATAVARKLGYPKDGVPCVVAATATPYKFPETCRRAFGEDVLADPPPSFRDLETLPIAQRKIVEIGEIDQAVRDLF
ncbi:MAG: threonine synthase [Kiritimatiellae bacterium]|nr:threonine synthase [Kiritimatiellia bacterium]